MKATYKRIKNFLLKRLKNACKKYNQEHGTNIDYEQQVDYLEISKANSSSKVREFVEKLEDQVDKWREEYVDAKSEIKSLKKRGANAEQEFIDLKIRWLDEIKNKCETYNQINNTNIDYEKQLDYLIINKVESLKEIRRFINKLKWCLGACLTDEQILIFVLVIFFVIPGLVGFPFI